MSNLNINGRTVDPKSIREIPVPRGKDPKAYLKENENLIKKNFRDELYFEQNGHLFVTEDKFVVENLGIRNPKDAKVRMGAVPAVALMIDNEDDAHKVTNLKIEGASRSKEWLDDNLKLEKGDRVNLHDMQKEADRLFATGRFLSVDFVPKASDKGIELSLQVQEVPEQVQIQGRNQPLSASRLNELTAKFKKPLTRENIEAGLQAIKSELDGDANLALRDIHHQVNGDSLQIYLDTTALPKALNVQGLAPEEVANVQKFFPQPLNPNHLDAGLEALRKHYNDQGEILPQVNFTYGRNKAGESTLTLDMRKTDMPHSIAVSGASVYSEKEIQDLFPKPLTMTHIQQGLQLLQKKYNDDGYLLMPPEGVSADLKDGKLTVDVHEAKMGDLMLSGNDKTKDEVIKREMRIKAGEPVNVKTLNEDLQRVSGTGLFANVQHSVEPDPDHPDKVRVRVHTSEEKSSAVNVGAGYSMSNGPFGTASLNLGNVAGMDRRVSADVTLGTKVWGGGLSYYDPWAFKGRTSLGASVYHRQWQGPYSDEARTGAKVTVGRPLGDIYSSPWRADVTLDAQRIGIDEQYSVSGTGTDYRVGIKPSLTYNTLDNPSLPHEGMKWTSSVEPTWDSGRILGKVDTQFDYYHPMGERFTLHGGVQGGTILGDAPLYEKNNNAGLGRTLMGWDSDGRLVGSNYAIGTAGVNAQIWGPISATAKVTAGDFFDGTDFKPKVGAGVGINVKLGNFGVLNAGYGYKLVGKEQGDSPGAFHIGFGVPF